MDQPTTNDGNEERRRGFENILLNTEAAAFILLIHVVMVPMINPLAVGDSNEGHRPTILCQFPDHIDISTGDSLLWRKKGEMDRRPLSIDENRLNPNYTTLWNRSAPMQYNLQILESSLYNQKLDVECAVKKNGQQTDYYNESIQFQTLWLTDFQQMTTQKELSVESNTNVIGKPPSLVIGKIQYSSDYKNLHINVVDMEDEPHDTLQGKLELRVFEREGWLRHKTTLTLGPGIHQFWLQGMKHISKVFLSLCSSSRNSGEFIVCVKYMEILYIEPTLPTWFAEETTSETTTASDDEIESGDTDEATWTDELLFLLIVLILLPIVLICVLWRLRTWQRTCFRCRPQLIAEGKKGEKTSETTAAGVEGDEEPAQFQMSTETGGLDGHQENGEGERPESEVASTSFDGFERETRFATVYTPNHRWAMTLKNLSQLQDYDLDH